MSDYHIRAAGKQTLQCVFHIPVPAGNNAVGTPWRTCVIEDPAVDNVSSIGPSLLAEEVTSLAAGELIEVVESLRVSWDWNETLGQRVARVTSVYTSTKSKVTSMLALKYKYWGGSGDVT